MAKLKAGDPDFPRKVQEFVDQWNQKWGWYYDLEPKAQQYLEELYSSPYLPYIEGIGRHSARGEEMISSKDLKSFSYTRCKFYLKGIQTKG